MFYIIEKFDKFIEKMTLFALIVSIVVMVLVSMAMIVTRWMSQSYLWMDPLVRHLVFFSSFLGGVLATGNNTHIGIDVLSKILESRKLHFLQVNLKRIMCIAAIVILVWITKASIDFVKMEAEFGKEAFWGIHSGQLVTLIPIGFGLITIRYFFNFILTFKSVRA